MDKTANTHHPFCSWFLKPSEGCKMCEKLYKSYPIKIDNITKDSLYEITRKYFPDVKIIKK